MLCLVDGTGSIPREFRFGQQVRFRRLDHFCLFFGVQQGLFRTMAPDVAGAFLQDVIMAAARVLLRGDEPKSRLHEVTSSLVEFLRGGLIVA